MTDCEQQIYSNEYQDYLIEHTGDEALIKQWYDTDCVQFASRRFAVIYQAATVEDAGNSCTFSTKAALLRSALLGTNIERNRSVGSQKTSGTRIVWKWCIGRVCRHGDRLYAPGVYECRRD